MRIRLNRFYSSAKVSSIPPGEYEASDPRLNGQAAYLVGIEVAEWVDSVPLATKQLSGDEVEALAESDAKPRKRKAVSDGN